MDTPDGMVLSLLVAQEASAAYHLSRDLLAPCRRNAYLVALAPVTGGRWCRRVRALSLIRVNILEFAEVLFITSQRDNDRRTAGAKK